MGLLDRKNKETVLSLNMVVRSFNKTFVMFEHKKKVSFFLKFYQWIYFIDARWSKARTEIDTAKDH